MAHREGSLKLTAKEIATSFAGAGWAERYPPVMTVEQAADLLQIPKQTVYDWRSRGLLGGCCRKVGKHLRFFRDKLLIKVFNEGLNTNGK